MKLIKSSFKILKITSNPLILLELAGRTCYKSEDKITPGSSEKMCKFLLNKQHESVIEHASATVKFIVDRGVTHELVRHRLASYSQESTRYCNYSGGVTFIIPPWIDIKEDTYTMKEYVPMYYKNEIWFRSMLYAELNYITLLKEGWKPQQARSVLPNSLKTEIVTTANFREWRHIFKLRCAEAAHPQMREIMIPLNREFQQKVPVIFDELH